MRTIISKWMSILGLFVVGYSAPAQAQFAAEVFHPQASEATSTWSTAHSDVLPHLTPSGGLVLHFADDPVELVRINEDGSQAGLARLLDEQLKADLLLALGLFDVLELGVAFPVVLYQTGEAFDEFDGVDAFSIADIRFTGRAQLFQAAGFGAALQATVFVPTGSQEAFQSDGETRLLPSLILDWAGNVGIPVRIAGNVGYEIREGRSADTFAADDRYIWNGGLELGIIPDSLSIIGSAFGAIDTADDTRTAHSAEAQGGFKIFWAPGLTSTVGAGGAIASGVGSPDVRLIASLGYAPSVADMDTDGVDGSADQCADGVEDIDGFEDHDGCPDPDNDQDGLADADDACPNEAEDVDGFEDADGCPDPDNDQDGVFDINDACPDEKGLAEKRGCPFVDPDGDGIDSIDDKCPDKAEDMDGFQDNDGCPDPDNDNDGILDADDKCPLEPEVINGIKDEDGCPDKGTSSVRLTEGRIEILEKVYFDTGKSKIKKRSYNILKQVASVLKSRTDLKRLRVEGHTDSRGSDASNLELSQRRAAAVREFLIKEGVESDRLTARGYGESHPVGDNKKKSGREINRRVEFHIVEKSK